MKFTTGGLLAMIILVSCNKAIRIDLPYYEPQISIEMYLEKGSPLLCLLSESLPYTDTAINRSLDDKSVIFSDGISSDTLVNKPGVDNETGRLYNYSNPKILMADTTKTYTITVIDGEKKVYGTTRFSSKYTRIDSVVSRPSVNNTDSFSIGMAFSDPAGIDNYYRILIARNLYDFNSEPTDFFLNDLAFDGQSYSYFSDPVYAKNDTVIVRVYSLTREHYDYLKSSDEARSSNFNPFAQSSRIMSNITGGLGIFTTIRYDERRIVVR